MKFTLSWLRDHLDTTASLDQIAATLVNLGLEVESIHNPGEALKGLVIGEVVKREKHPNADRLNLCRVNAGTGDLIQVVCGATNVREGMKVAFAPLGTIIPITGQALKKGIIREVESFGMLCSARELLLGEDHEGIMDLDTPLPPGTPFLDYLGKDDPIIELSITPNRSDCFGVRGIARDLAAAGLGTLKPLDISIPQGPFPPPLTITIEDGEACPAFKAVLLRGVKNVPSPQWVQKRLEAVGQRAISSLVDVTNLLNLDMCRPLHVFDADKIKGNLTITCAQGGEIFESLKDTQVTLPKNAIVIKDEAEIISFAGIMGGASTACHENTTNVLIECAAFNPIMIAEAGQKTKVLSDSRARFERGVDPTTLEPGLWRAVSLIQEWCGGEIAGVITGSHKRAPLPREPQIIPLTAQDLLRLSGTPISLEVAQGHLENLGFNVTQKDSATLEVKPPSYRPDIERTVDLIEEVLRMIGYDHIPAVPLPSAPPIYSAFEHQDLARRAMLGRGLQEVVAYSLVSKQEAALFGGEGTDLHLESPVNEGLSVMRPSAIPPLLAMAVKNAQHGSPQVALGEVGPCFRKTWKQNQLLVATGLRAGTQGHRHWATPQRSVDVFDAKADILAILQAHGLGESSGILTRGAPSYFHPGRSGVYKQGSRVIAQFGELHPKILKAYGCKIPVVAFEVFIENLPKPKMKKTSLHISPFQAVVRDFAFLMPKDKPVQDVVKVIQQVDKNLITRVQIFDIYEGDKIGAQEKSVAVEVRLEPTTGTLTEDLIQALSTKIIEQVEEKTGAKLR